MPDDLLAVKERAVERLLALPGVTGVGLGGRVRGGRPVDEPVLKVFVERKRPVAELAPDEVLPAEIEGYGVDVSEAGYAVDFVDPAPPVPGSPLVGPTDDDTGKYRPLRGGTQFQADVNGSGTGTLGCLLVDPTENVPNTSRTKVYTLTNLHVLRHTDEKTGGLLDAPVEGSTRCGQPTKYDSVTKCCSDQFGTYVKGARDAVRDAAIAKLDPGQVWRAEVEGIGPVDSIAVPPTPQDAQSHTYQLRKRGATTRLTGGTVEAVNSSVQTKDGLLRTNVIVMTPNPNPDVRPGKQVFAADHGDSGSLVVNATRQAVGLLFGGTASEDANHNPIPIVKAHVTPLADVLNAFGAAFPVTVATSQANGEDCTVPGGQPVAMPEPPRELLPSGFAGPVAYGTVMTRVRADLEGSAAGRRLAALWLTHHEELLDLVDHRRRVTVAWHRGGGPALFQTLLRMAANPRIAMPATINGVSPMTRADRILTVLHANASPALRDALDLARASLPDPALLTYDQFLGALSAR
jgi:hypothetical protein